MYYGDQQDPIENTPHHTDDPWENSASGAAPGGPVPGGRVKKRRTGLKITALVLACALVSALAGGGGAWLVSRFSGGRSSTTLYEGSSAPVEVKVDKVRPGDPLTPAQIYAENVNASVGITTELVGTNSFGFPVARAAAGSGFIISEDGYIVTNYHVIKGATSIKVAFQNGKSMPATLVGGEAQNDVAVLKIEGTDFPTVTLGNSDNLVVGEEVYTIGNPLGELTWSFTNGLVSAKDRTVTTSEGETMNMLQTNTTINSGNSGGPLFNRYGEVVGITSAKLSSNGGSGASIEGLGFAIPINDVRGMIEDIIAHGYVTGKPNLGILINDVSPEAEQYGVPKGAFIEAVLPGSCADKAGLKRGDIVTGADGEEVDSSAALQEVIRSKKAGDTVSLTVRGESGERELSVKLDEDNQARQDALSDLRDELSKKRQEAAQKQQSGMGGQPQGGSFFHGWPFFGFGF